MNILRLLALCILGTSTTLSQAGAMKRYAQEQESQAKRLCTEKQFNVSCRDNQIIENVAQSILTISPIIRRILDKATNNTIVLEKMPHNTMVLIIDWMTFILKNSNLLSAFRRERLGRHIFEQCFVTAKSSDFQMNQKKILEFLTLSNILQLDDLTEAIQLIIAEKPDLFFARDVKSPYNYIIGYNAPEPIKILLNKAFLIAKNKYEALSIIPADTITNEIIPKLNARSLCNFACTTQDAYAACTAIKLDQCCNISRVFAVNAHSISMIEKFVTFLENRTTPRNEDNFDVDFLSPLLRKVTICQGATHDTMQEVASQDFSFTPQQAIIKAILLLWVNRTNQGILLSRLITIPEVQITLSEILADQDQEWWPSVTISNGEIVEIGIKDILATVMLWALFNHKNLSISDSLDNIRASILGYKYHNEIFNRILEDRCLNQTLTNQIISFATRENMPYFLHYLLVELHNKFSCFIDKKLEKNIARYARRFLKDCPLLQHKILLAIGQN